jgi:hypothetical protein
LVNARIMARRSRPYRIGGAICRPRKLLYGRDGAGDTWPKRGPLCRAVSPFFTKEIKTHD